MVTQSILLTLLLGSAPDNLDASDVGEPICEPLPPEPQRLDAQPFASTAADGTRTWGAAATYVLSSGDSGEAFMVLDEHGAGEAQLLINGEIIAHVTIESPTSSEGPVVTTWMPASVSAAPEVIAEMSRVDLPAVLAESMPQEFKCSAWGKKVMKAGKYMAAGVIGASGAACCIASQGLACLACGAGVAVGIMAVDEFADGYCD